MDDPDNCTAEQILSNLESRGYRQVHAFNELIPGARVRHVGEQYTDAIIHGTARIIAVLQKPSSSWEMSNDRPDIEVIIQRDPERVRGMPAVAQWADYHTVVVEALPV